MMYFKTFIALIFVGHSAFAQNVGPTSQFGTGQYYANAPCPYNQTSLPSQVIKRSERLKDEATQMQTQLASLKNKLQGIEEDRVYGACQASVNNIIENVCGGGSRGRGSEGVDMYEDHMRGYSSYISFNKLNYSRSYEVVYNGYNEARINALRNIAAERFESEDSFENNQISVGDGIESYSDDKATGGGGGGPVVVSPNSSCFDYALNNGMIDSKICFAASGADPRHENNCKSCLTPCKKPNNSGLNAEYEAGEKCVLSRGFYPTFFKQAFDLQQQIAKLERNYKMAVGKAACTEKHIDNASGPLDANAYRQCILDADPMATAADYCLFCDETGRAQRQGFDMNRWGPSILTAGAWALGGLFAYNQMQKTREGNWEAGDPSDDRKPVVMTNYVMNGFGQVVDSLKSAGAFGCSPSAGINGQGQIVTTNGLGNSLQALFNGNANFQVGGANGYPGAILDANGNIISGGAFANNPHAGPWTGGVNIDANIQAQNAAIAQAQANLAALQRQNEQRIAGLSALANLNATLQGLAQQRANTDAQIAQAQAQAAQIYGTLGLGGTAGGVSGVGNGGIRIGLDVSGYAGFGAAAGVPGTTYPPMPYNQPNYVIPNSSGSSSSDNSILGIVPGMSY